MKRRAFRISETSASQTRPASNKNIAPHQPEYEDPKHTLPPIMNVGSSSLTPKTIVQLQRVIGNTAVQRLLATRAPVKVHQHSSPTIQRKPYGLESAGSIGNYTDHAVKLWKTKKQMSLQDFTSTMMKSIAEELDSHGVPIPGWRLDTGLDTDGEFKQEPWKILINPNKFSDRPNVKTLGDLHEDELTNVVGTFYHEARHADQDFLVARMLAGKGDTVAQIHAKTKIPTKIAKKAVDKKLTNASVDRDQIPGAKILFDTMYGEHKELVEFVVELSGDIQSLQSLARAAAKTADKNALHAVEVKSSNLVTKLQRWSTVFDKKLDVLGKKQQKTALDQQMFNDVTNINKQVKMVITEWKAIRKPLVKDDSEDFAQTLEDFLTELEPVYRRLENEKDAFSVEETVKNKLKPKL
jgi:hypothetical protein